MKLIPVNPHDDDHLQVLYELLEERPEYANVSHKKMPTWNEHADYVWRSGLLKVAPRLAWDLIDVETHAKDTWCPVGSVYLTDREEIGIGIFKAFQRKGYAYEAVRMFIAKHGPRRYLWNVNPANTASIALAQKLGFIGPIQHTYSLEMK